MNRKQFFDKLAENWDSSPKIKQTIKKIEQKIFPLLKQFFKKGDNILDLGCGTGILLPYLEKLVGKKGKVYALDFSQKMLNKAKEKFADRFVYVKANAHNMPFENEKFDGVVCFNTFPHFVNKLKALKEVYRVLKKDGYFIIAHSKNREEINSHHKKLEGLVAKDFIPTDKELVLLSKKAKFSEINFIENNKIYFCVTKK